MFPCSSSPCQDRSPWGTDPSLKALAPLKIPFAATVGSRRRRFWFAGLDWVKIQAAWCPSLAPDLRPLVLGDASARPPLGCFKVSQTPLGSASRLALVDPGPPCARNTIPRGTLTGDTGIAGSSRRAVWIRAPYELEHEQCRASTAAMTRCRRGTVVCFTGRPQRGDRWPKAGLHVLCQ
jgi:hypothetical protein